MMEAVRISERTNAIKTLNLPRLKRRMPEAAGSVFLLWPCDGLVRDVDSLETYASHENSESTINIFVNDHL
jgi:hypothetical protein